MIRRGKAESLSFYHWRIYGIDVVQVGAGEEANLSRPNRLLNGGYRMIRTVRIDEYACI